MEKLKMHTPDIAEENFKKLAALFPNAITETKNENGEVVRAIDADVLRQEISSAVVEGTQERYQFTWPDKKRSVVLANQPIAKTLRLDRSKSVGRDGTPGSIDTENIYIEGDNLDALKLLQETYLGKVKMIYIDPPYNTGNDFVYEDDFSQSADEYIQGSGQLDEQGNRLVQNTESNGRFHTDWLNMLYPRLRIARDLLTDDGVIFISIDDNEIENLKKICYEIFGIKSFVATLVWEKKKKGSFLSNSITNVKEYIIVFCKNLNSFEGLIGEINSSTETYPCVNATNKREKRIIPAGIESKFKEKNYFLPKGYEISDTTMSLVLHSDLVIKNGLLSQDLVIEGNWRYSQESMTNYAMNNELYITRDLYLRRIVKDTRYKTLKDLLPRVGDISVFNHSEIDINNLMSSGWGSNEDADEELRLLFGVQKLLDYPKPLRLLEKLLISYRNSKNSIILDFFSGSATTAHAVMNINVLDEGHRKFIMIQLPEITGEDSPARKAGYETICDIGEKRIKIAGQQLRETLKSGNSSRIHNLINPEKKEDADFNHIYTVETHPITFEEYAIEEKKKKERFSKILEELDVGFRVFRVDSSNMEDVYYTPAELQQDQLTLFADNIKPDRTPEDLLFQVMLDLGIMLSSEIEETEIDGKKVFSVAGGYLIACFDKDVTEETVKAIAQKQPFYAVFRDSGMASDSVATNFEQIFETYSPKTVRRVI